MKFCTRLLAFVVKRLLRSMFRSSVTCNLGSLPDRLARLPNRSRPAKKAESYFWNTRKIFRSGS